ncbi:hypothetical protein C2I18_05030 [Paenibacillus sp. PK3_47]|uniref:hypothetical protein n=1 Tax=Paenibacillus sp. PK3_47 TaxID=2072642 RepID=UPI00201D2DE1|nr:hypothetical protein [Paenibacillus sp. PK3_47]UQZ32981.1 hypothetical protein C2I18_05030 [Paenibacillus sp. PK3_47]
MMNKETANASNTGNDTPEWIWQAKRQGPFQKDGFTPELMARIELAAEKRSAAGRRLLSPKSFSIAGLSAILLFGILVWPMGGLGKGGYSERIATLFKDPASAAVQPSASPSASPSSASQGLRSNMSTAKFQFGGEQYYMPVSHATNKSRAKAVETELGIVWSPPPPMENYLKQNYTHNTEPYTLYLTPKGHSELSVETAHRLYTFPLYAGGAQTYYELGYILGAGDYLLFTHGSYTLGREKAESLNTATVSAINLRKAAAGEITAPKDLFTINNTLFTLYKAFVAVDQDREELLMVDYKEDGQGGVTQVAELYDVASGSKRVVTGTVTTEERIRTVKEYYNKLAIDKEVKYYVAHYEVNGEEREIEISMLTGQQWLEDWWLEEYGEKYDPSKFVN